MGEHLPDPSRDDRDPLEAELKSLQPVPPSPDLGRRIGERLAAVPVRARVRGWLVASGLAAAACVAVALLVWRNDDPAGDATGHGHVAVAPAPNGPSTRPGQAIDATVPLPTRLAYHRALGESPEAFDALLDRRRPAGASRRADRAAAPMNAFSRSTADLSRPTGDSI